MSDAGTQRWFGVRSLFVRPGGLYEERVVMLLADHLDHAIERAEQEADEYVDGSDIEQVGLVQAFWMFDAPGDRAEVFSLMRESDLEPDDSATRYFDTGTELQRDWHERGPSID